VTAKAAKLNRENTDMSWTIEHHQSAEPTLSQTAKVRG
jgi:hypothetical protein